MNKDLQNKKWIDKFNDNVVSMYESSLEDKYNKTTKTKNKLAGRRTASVVAWIIMIFSLSAAVNPVRNWIYSFAITWIPYAGFLYWSSLAFSLVALWFFEKQFRRVADDVADEVVVNANIPKFKTAQLAVMIVISVFLSFIGNKENVSTVYGEAKQMSFEQESALLSAELKNNEAKILDYNTNSKYLVKSGKDKGQQTWKTEDKVDKLENRNLKLNKDILALNKKIKEENKGLVGEHLEVVEMSATTSSIVIALLILIYVGLIFFMSFFDRNYAVAMGKIPSTSREERKKKVEY